MSAPHAYERDPYLKELPVRVLATGSDDGRSWAVLDDTVLFPEGGGQPADHGLLGDVPVVDVRTVEGRAVHFLEAPVPEGPTLLRLEWARRFDHMQQHTGQHLLTAVAADRFGWETTAFHLGPETCDVELAVPSISPADLERLEEAVAACIRAAVPVTARRVLPEELPGLAVRSRGLPEGHSGDVRLVEIAGVDLNTCGGTHLRSTAELEGLKLLGTERLRGGTRLLFVSGGRVRRRLGAAEERNARLRVLLGAPDPGLAEAVAVKLAQLAEAQKALRGAEEELAEAKAEALAAAGLPVVDAHFEGRDLVFLGRVAKQFAELPVGGLAFLTGERDGVGVFVLAAGAGSSSDVRALGSAVAAELGGRGGGSGKLFQGKASLERRAGALTLLRTPSP
ncbi:MAG TPA: alanyl-tRNA editing protein [Thermoanaerobaculia bacterium]|nr:alanyl-tRNA editing protein [Thermoanaerobaculia bacterium]